MQFFRTKDPLEIPARAGILKMLPAGKNNWGKTRDLVYNHHCLNMQIDARLMQQIFPDCTYSYHEFDIKECQEYKYPRRKMVKN